VHLIPVISFVKDICIFLDDKYFLQKNKEQILSEVVALQQRRITLPIKSNNFSDMPFGDSRIVCRDDEVERVKTFVYGRPEDLRKQHSLCIYGYGGVGKTALVLEALKQIARDIQDETTINEYQPEYVLFFSAKQRKLDLSPETGRFIERGMRCHFKSADELIQLVLSELSIDTLRKFKNEGLIVVDNLETLPLEERKKIKNFVDTQTPSDHGSR
jgi:DNA replication protein DnaC